MLQYVGEHFLASPAAASTSWSARKARRTSSRISSSTTPSIAAARRIAYPIGLHHYEPHVKDWKHGDPTWQGGKGKGTIGVLNYLAEKGMNSFYTLTMNNHGDAMDTNPWISYDEHTRYDVSKLAQWEIVFSHMDRLGLQLMMITQEEEGERSSASSAPSGNFTTAN